MVFNWFRRQFSDTKEENQNQQTETVQEKPTVPSPEPETETTQAQSQQVAEDYLAWAKAAYKNIQTRQHSEETPAETELTTPAETEVTPEVEIPRSEVTSPSELETTPATEEIETTITEVADSTEVEAESVVEVAEPIATVAIETTTDISETADLKSSAAIEAQPQTTVTTPQPEIEQTSEAVVTETTAATTASSEISPAVETVEVEEATTATETAAVPFWARDDRQARLERLKATAIEEPEPEVQPAVVAEAPSIEEISGLAFDEGFLWSAEVLAAQGRRPEDVSIEEITWLKKLRQGLDKTRRNILNQLKAIVGQGPLNQAAVMEIEALLLQADVGVEATDYIIGELQSKLREEALPPEQAIAYLKQILRNMLEAPLKKSHKVSFVPEKETFNIWLMTGVNGAGKTTTIGKIAHLADKSGYKCLIAAADTFRAAAVEQVKVWGQRSGVEVVANPGKNTDPAAVVFDAIAAAKSRGTELLLVDTAGRLQNKKNLMEELTKIRRIIDKKASDAHVESLLVLDATLGQNGLRQAQVFSEAAKLSGVVLTKLDGTAKGGVALAVVKQLGLPIRFIGAGEGIEDLRPFSSYEFVEALLSG
ncbi:MAG TPA: signal recognition particle-docking protein FtsY [Leptolyngbyaceae cyanobacterium]